MKNVGVILIANFSGKLLKIRKRKELKMREEYKKRRKSNRANRTGKRYGNYEKFNENKKRTRNCK